MFSLTQHRRWNPFALSLIQCTETLLRNNTCRTLLRAPNLGTKHKKAHASSGTSSAVGTASFGHGCKAQLPLPQQHHTAQEAQPLCKTPCQPQLFILVEHEAALGCWIIAGGVSLLALQSEFIHLHFIRRTKASEDLSLKYVQNTTASSPWNLCSPGFIPGLAHRLG